MKDLQGQGKDRPHTVPRMTRDELVAFVHAFCDGRVYTSSDATRVGGSSSLAMVFMPYAFGTFDGWTEQEMEEIGLLWETLDKAGPRAINGCPMFTSMHIMHRLDVEIAKKAIEKEQERRKTSVEIEGMP